MFTLCVVNQLFPQLNVHSHSSCAISDFHLAYPAKWIHTQFSLTERQFSPYSLALRAIPELSRSTTNSVNALCSWQSSPTHHSILPRSLYITLHCAFSREFIGSIWLTVYRSPLGEKSAARCLLLPRGWHASEECVCVCVCVWLWVVWNRWDGADEAISSPFVLCVWCRSADGWDCSLTLLFSRSVSFSRVCVAVCTAILVSIDWGERERERCI